MPILDKTNRFTECWKFYKIHVSGYIQLESGIQIEVMKVVSVQCVRARNAIL